MHALLVTLTIGPDHAAAAAATFMNDILPRVTSADGFRASYCLEPRQGEGFGFVLFDSESQARAAAPAPDDWAAPGVTIHRVDARRVAVAVP